MRIIAGKRAVALGCAAIMLPCLTSCGDTAETGGKWQNAEQTTEDAGGPAPAWEKYADEEITLNWYVNYSWFATPWGENLVSKTITEETGVNINFITPIGNETEPLNELADAYDPYFWEVSDPVAVNWYTQEDGNIYAYPNSSVTPQDVKENKLLNSNETFLVRGDIYEAIGSPDMTTPEGCAAAVNEGNVSFDKYLMNFLAIPWEKDGEYYDRYTDPEYIRWLKMFRELGEEGYLVNDIFVDTRTQMEEKISQGRYFCMLYQYSDMLSQQKTLYANDPDSIYIAVDGPKNSAGDDPTLPTTGVGGWTVTMISKNCKNPERAIAFLDYLMSEHGQMVTYLGVEGETYDMVDGKPVLKEEVRELLDTDRASYDRIYGADDAYWMLQDNVMQLQWKQEVSPAVAQLEEWTRQYVVYNGQADVVLPAGLPEAAADDKITKLWSETLPRLLLASTEEEFDEILETFVAEREALGFDEMMQKKTEYMGAAKEKLGMD